MRARIRKSQWPRLYFGAHWPIITLSSCSLSLANPEMGDWDTSAAVILAARSLVPLRPGPHPRRGRAAIFAP